MSACARFRKRIPRLNALVLKEICGSVMAQLAKLPVAAEGYTQDVLCALATQREQSVATSVRAAEALVRTLPSPPPPELCSVLGALVPCAALFCAVSSFIGTQRHSRVLKDEKALTWLRNTRTSWFVLFHVVPVMFLTLGMCFRQRDCYWVLSDSAQSSARPGERTTVGL